MSAVAQAHALPSSPFSEEPVSIGQTAAPAATTTVEAKRRRYSTEMYKYTERQAREARRDARSSSLLSTDSISSTSSAGVSPTDSAPEA